MPKVIDLFAGLGGIRLGFEQAMLELRKIEQKIEKEEARVVRYREALAVAKTEKQLQKAEENLSKAEISLEKAIDKRNAMKTKVEMYSVLG